MRTITIDIINEKALSLLRGLEGLKLIRLRKDGAGKKTTATDWTKYKGAMSKQHKSEIGQQLNELRSEWD